MIVGLLGIKQERKLGIPFNQHFNFSPSPLHDLINENKTINTINSIIYRRKYDFICEHNLATNETAGFQSHDSKFLGRNWAVTNSEQVSRTRKNSCENAWHTNGVSRTSFLDLELGSSVMGFRLAGYKAKSAITDELQFAVLRNTRRCPSWSPSCRCRIG